MPLIPSTIANLWPGSYYNQRTKQVCTSPHDQTLKLAMFPDDILIFSSKPNTDLPNLKNILDTRRDISGLRINYAKSEILPLKQTRPRPWFYSSLFTIAKDKIRYLGIYIGRSPTSIYSLNYPPLLDKILR